MAVWFQKKKRTDLRLCSFKAVTRISLMSAPMAVRCALRSAHTHYGITIRISGGARAFSGVPRRANSMLSFADPCKALRDGCRWETSIFDGWHVRYGMHGRTGVAEMPRGMRKRHHGQAAGEGLFLGAMCPGLFASDRMLWHFSVPLK